MKTIIKILEWIPYLGVSLSLLFFMFYLIFDLCGGFRKRTKYSNYIQRIADNILQYHYIILFILSMYHAFFLFPILISLLCL